MHAPCFKHRSFRMIRHFKDMLWRLWRCQASDHDKQKTSRETVNSFGFWNPVEFLNSLKTKTCLPATSLGREDFGFSAFVRSYIYIYSRTPPPSPFPPRYSITQNAKHIQVAYGRWSQFRTQDSGKKNFFFSRILSVHTFLL